MMSFHAFKQLPIDQRIQYIQQLAVEKVRAFCEQKTDDPKYPILYQWVLSRSPGFNPEHYFNEVNAIINKMFVCAHPDAKAVADVKDAMDVKGVADVKADEKVAPGVVWFNQMMSLESGVGMSGWWVMIDDPLKFENRRINFIMDVIKQADAALFSKAMGKLVNVDVSNPYKFIHALESVYMLAAFALEADNPAAIELMSEILNRINAAEYNKAVSAENSDGQSFWVAISGMVTDSNRDNLLKIFLKKADVKLFTETMVKLNKNDLLSGWEVLAEDASYAFFSFLERADPFLLARANLDEKLHAKFQAAEVDTLDLPDAAAVMRLRQPAFDSLMEFARNPQKLLADNPKIFLTIANRCVNDLRLSSPELERILERACSVASSISQALHLLAIQYYQRITKEKKQRTFPMEMLQHLVLLDPTKNVDLQARELIGVELISRVGPFFSLLDEKRQHPREIIRFLASQANCQQVYRNGLLHAQKYIADGGNSENLKTLLQMQQTAETEGNALDEYKDEVINRFVNKRIEVLNRQALRLRELKWEQLGEKIKLRLADVKSDVDEKFLDSLCRLKIQFELADYGSKKQKKILDDMRQLVRQQMPPADNARMFEPNPWLGDTLKFLTDTSALYRVESIAIDELVIFKDLLGREVKPTLLESKLKSAVETAMQNPNDKDIVLNTIKNMYLLLREEKADANTAQKLQVYLRIFEKRILPRLDVNPTDVLQAAAPAGVAKKAI